MQDKPLDVPYCGVRKNVIDKARPKLRKDKLALLSKWITERYTIHVKKDVEGAPKPWTDCPILQNVKFTNVRREHDRATRWLIETICHHPTLGRIAKIANCILFRLYNKWETSELIGQPFKYSTTFDEWKAEATENLRKREAEDPKYVFFTSAFNTGGMKAAVGRLTGEKYIPARPLAFMEYMLKEDVDIHIDRAISPEEVVKILMGYSGIGEFLAYQMFVDFTYIPDFRFSENHYTVSGPGCSLGLSFLFEDTDGMTDEECLFWLRDNQDEVFDICFTSLMSDLPPEDRRMNVMSLENCFCEFSKYSRCTDQIAEGKKPRARVSYAGTEEKEREVAKKSPKTDDPSRSIPYMGKRITEEEKALLDGFPVDTNIYKRPCYHGTLFDPKPEYAGPNLPHVPVGDVKMFQLLGTNGSGKSTIPKGLVDRDKDAYIMSTEMKWLAGNMSKGFEVSCKMVDFATVCPNLKVILIGNYDPSKNIAGCDLLVRATMEQALTLIAKDIDLRQYHILMEGVVLSSSKWHIERLRDEMNIHPVMMFMDTPLEVCMERLKKRNASQGKESVNTKNVESKWHETRLKQGRCAAGEMGYHGVTAEWVDHTMGIDESIDWFIDEKLTKR